MRWPFRSDEIAPSINRTRRPRQIAHESAQKRFIRVLPPVTAKIRHITVVNYLTLIIRCNRYYF